MTFFQLNRVRGGEVQKDESRTNFTTALHAGWFPVAPLSVGVERHYQRWLSTPANVSADPTGAVRDTWTIATGVRGHFHSGGHFWLRPAIVRATGLDDPMRAQGYQIVQLDVPLFF